MAFICRRLLGAGAFYARLFPPKACRRALAAYASAATCSANENTCCAARGMRGALPRMPRAALCYTLLPCLYAACPLPFLRAFALARFALLVAVPSGAAFFCGVADFLAAGRDRDGGTGEDRGGRGGTGRTGLPPAPPCHPSLFPAIPWTSVPPPAPQQHALWCFKPFLPPPILPTHSFTSFSLPDSFPTHLPDMSPNFMWHLVCVAF